MSSPHPLPHLLYFNCVVRTREYRSPPWGRHPPGLQEKGGDADASGRAGREKTVYAPGAGTPLGPRVRLRRPPGPDLPLQALAPNLDGVPDPVRTSGVGSHARASAFSRWLSTRAPRSTRASSPDPPEKSVLAQLLTPPRLWALKAPGGGYSPREAGAEVGGGGGAPFRFARAPARRPRRSHLELTPPHGS